MKVNDKVVCIKQGDWIIIRDNIFPLIPPPKYGETYIIQGINKFSEFPNKTFLALVGFVGEVYNAIQFVPLQSWDEATEFIKESEKEIAIEV